MRQRKDRNLHAPKRVQVNDFLARDGVAIDSPDDRLNSDDTLISGEFLHQELRSGLFLHVSDVVEERPFTATSSIPEGLSCIFFIEGKVDLTIGDRRFEFGKTGGAQIEGTAMICARSDSFERATRGRQRLRHLVVSATPQWLNLEGPQGDSDTQRLPVLLREHLALRRWRPTARMTEIVRRLVEPSHFSPMLRNLYMEGHAIDIVTETLLTLLGDAEATSETCSPRDALRISRAQDFIRANLNQEISVEAIAREAGMNASGLQKLFRSAEGMSIFEYVRHKRMEWAHDMLQADGLSLHEVSLFAGYSSPANFATAFRRQFGVPPSTIRKGADKASGR